MVSALTKLLSSVLWLGCDVELLRMNSSADGTAALALVSACRFLGENGSFDEAAN